MGKESQPEKGEITVSELFPNISRKELKFVARDIEKENRNYGDNFVEMKAEVRSNGSTTLISAFRNRHYLVQVYRQDCWIRISVNRTGLNPENRRWFDGISWDALMKIKKAVGYGDRDAIEIYPSDQKVINVANIRHLFILPKDHNMDCIWGWEKA